MKTNVTKWGNSLAIRIPAPFAGQIGVTQGDDVEINLQDQMLVIKKSQPTLDQLLIKVTDENVHKEVDWGEPQGKEIW